MTTDSNLLNGLMFSELELATFQSVTDVVDKRFNRWLVNRNTVNPISDSFLGNLSLLELDIQKRIDMENNTNRLLLKVEEEGRERRLEKLKDQQQLHARAKKLLDNRLAKTLQEAIADTHFLTKKGLNITERDADDLTNLFRTLYLKSTTFNKIWNAVKVMPRLSEQLADLVNNPDFCKSLGRASPMHQIQGREAIGFLGIEGCKVIIPLVIAKNRLHGSSLNYPLSASKLWTYCITVGNAATHLLKEVDHNEPSEGFTLAICLLLANVAVLNIYDSCYEKTKHECMLLLREKNAMDLYFTVPQIEASSTVLADVITEYTTPVALKLLKMFEWDRLKHIQKGVTEELTRVPTHKRSKHGQALKQAKHYAKFILLRESRVFVKDHLRPFLSCAFLNDIKINKLINADLKRLNFQEVIEN